MPQEHASTAIDKDWWGVEPDPRDVYVVSQRDGEWVVERQESQRLTSTHDTKKDAVERALDLAQRKQTMLLVYQANGVCQESYDYRAQA